MGRCLSQTPIGVLQVGVMKVLVMQRHTLWGVHMFLLARSLEPAISAAGGAAALLSLFFCIELCRG